MIPHLLPRLKAGFHHVILRRFSIQFGENKVQPKKGLYFMKNDEVLVPKENSGSVMKVGDLSQIPLDHLSSLVDDLNILLEHGENFTSWPNVVSADVTTQADF